MPDAWPIRDARLPGHAVGQRAGGHQVIPDKVVGAILGACDGFDVLADWSAEWRILRVFDKNGNVTLRKDTYDVIGRTAYYNSDDPSLVLYGGPGEGQQTIYRFDQGYAIITGLVWKVVLPGIGPIFLDAGAVKMDLATFVVTYSGGQHQYWELTSVPCVQP